MRTYISPIGYDSRRVTRPVVNTGLGGDDEVRLVRPGDAGDTERATQAVADVEQLLQEIEPKVEPTVERVSIASFETTVRECCRILAGVPEERDLIVSLGGGARDVLLPLTVGALVFASRIDQTLFYSDIDGSVHEWTVPDLTARVPERATDTFETILTVDDWVSLTEIAEETGQSKSTVIRHVNDLEDVGIIETEMSGKAKRVQVAFSGELLWRTPDTGL
jgi:CRISPR-associated protein Csa3